MEDNKISKRELFFNKITLTKVLRLILFIIFSVLILKYALMNHVSYKLDTYNILKFVSLLSIVFIILDIYIPYVEFA